MHVGYERGLVSALAKGVLDVPQVLCLAVTLCGKAYDVGTGLDDAYALFHAAFGVGGGAGGHALQPQGDSAAEGQLAEPDGVAFAGGIVKEVYHFSLLLYFFFLKGEIRLRGLLQKAQLHL